MTLYLFCRIICYQENASKPSLGPLGENKVFKWKLKCRLTVKEKPILIACATENSPMGLPATRTWKSRLNFKKTITGCSKIPKFLSKLQPIKQKNEIITGRGEGWARLKQKFRKLLPKYGLPIGMLVKHGNMIRCLIFPFT